MVGDLISIMFYSFIFYIIYSILYRVNQVNRYVKKSTSDGTYSEEYKLMYSNHLKGQCIGASIILGIINLLEKFTNIIFAILIGAIIGFCLRAIFNKYYPNPKDNI